MKVKITYTTELENVPQECLRLLNYKINDGFKLAELLKQINNILLSYESNNQTLDSFGALDRINKIRSILADYDACLNDVSNILSGWSEYQLQNLSNSDNVDKQQQESSVQQSL
jgi:hypothetical protein